VRDGTHVLTDLFTWSKAAEKGSDSVKGNKGSSLGDHFKSFGLGPRDVARTKSVTGLNSLSKDVLAKLRNILKVRLA
jgi:hypothetical protein